MLFRSNAVEHGCPIFQHDVELVFAVGGPGIQIGGGLGHALARGGEELPAPVRGIMRAVAKLMTGSAYWL